MSGRKFTLLFLYVAFMKTIVRDKILLICISVLCLLIGGAIYLIFRPRTLYMFSCIPNRIMELLDATKHFFNIGENIDFVIYNLPAGLWTISYIILMQLIMTNARSISRILWTYSLPLCLTLVEILQLCKFVPGTFDILDIVVYIIPIIFSILIDIRYEKF